MKKLLIATTLAFTFNLASAGEIEFSPSEKEKQAFKFGLEEDLTVFFEGGESYFKYGDFVFTTPDDVFKTYSENELRGDKKYKNKQLIINGVVGGIKSGLNDKPYIELKAKGAFISPQAHFATSEEEIMDLNKGNKIRLICKGGGEIGGVPIFQDCLFSKSVIKSMLDERYKEYESLISGNLSVSVEIKKLAALINTIAKQSNDFSLCKDKILPTCFDKSIKKLTKKDEERLELLLKENFKLSKKE